MKSTHRKLHKGFTLMEVMVAVSIFAIVVTVGIGALLTINESYRKSQTGRQAIDSLTYILESMSRSIRTAQAWDPATSSPSKFTFTDQDGIVTSYEFQSPNIVMNIGSSGGSLAPGDYVLTPSNVQIENLTFTAFFPPVAKQSYLQINIQGRVTQAKQTSDFAFQTGVSKRILDTP